MALASTAFRDPVLDAKARAGPEVSRAPKAAGGEGTGVELGPLL